MITVDASAFREVRPAIARLRDEAGAAGLRLVHVQNAALPDRMSDAPAQMRFNMRNGISSVVLAGCTTEGCVESTAGDPMFNDYYVVPAQDCVASDDQAQHDAAMLLMRHRFDLARSDEIVATWAESARLPAGLLAGDRLIG